MVAIAAPTVHTYTVTPDAETPDAETPVTYTLDELRALKTEWLATYTPDVADWITIARYLGKETPLPYGWHTSKCYKAHIGNVDIELYEHDADWLPMKDNGPGKPQGGRNHITRLLIFCVYRLVACWYWDDTGKLPLDEQSKVFIRPGQWIETVRPAIAKAKSILAEQQADVEQIEYTNLRKQLLIGENV